MLLQLVQYSMSLIKTLLKSVRDGIKYIQNILSIGLKNLTRKQVQRSSYQFQEIKSIWTLIKCQGRWQNLIARKWDYNIMRYLQNKTKVLIKYSKKLQRDYHKNQPTKRRILLKLNSQFNKIMGGMDLVVKVAEISMMKKFKCSFIIIFNMQ